MDRYLNLADTNNRHLKAELQFIHSLSMDEVVEIIYASPEEAEERRNRVLSRLRGTEDKIMTHVVGCSVRIRRCRRGEKAGGEWK